MLSYAALPFVSLVSLLGIALLSTPVVSQSLAPYLYCPTYYVLQGRGNQIYLGASDTEASCQTRCDTDPTCLTFTVDEQLGKGTPGFCIQNSVVVPAADLQGPFVSGNYYVAIYLKNTPPTGYPATCTTVCSINFGIQDASGLCTPCPAGTVQGGTSTVCTTLGPSAKARARRSLHYNAYNPHRRSVGYPISFGAKNGTPVTKRNAFAATCESTEVVCSMGPGSDLFECVDTLNDYTSCGGCAKEGKGQDCRLIQGAKGVACQQGTCAVVSCEAEYNLLRGACVKV